MISRLLRVLKAKKQLIFQNSGTKSGYVTLDIGYKNTGATKSAITFLDGELGILKYRGYPIEQLAEKSSFIEVAYLLIYGELPTKEQLSRFSIPNKPAYAGA